MINNGVISEPISIRDPYDAMGININNEQIYLSYICTHSNINMYSAYKPIKAEGIEELKYEDYVDLHWGVTPITKDNVLKIIQTYEYPISNNWIYNKPVAPTDWCRLTDFINYNHRANPLFNNFRLRNGIGSANEVSGIAAFDVDVNNSADGSVGTMFALTPSSFNIQDYYFGVIVNSGSLPIPMWITEERTIGDTTKPQSIGFPVMDLKAGGYYAYPVISNIKKLNIDEDGFPSNAIFYTMPNVKKISFSVAQGQVMKITIDAKIIPFDILQVKVVMINRTSMPLRYGNVYYHLRQQTHKPEDTPVGVEFSKAIGNILIQSNTTYTYNDEESFINLVLNKTYLVWITSDSGDEILRYSVVVGGSNIPQQ